MYISVDLGGTSTRVASSKDLKTILNIEKFSTFKDLRSQKDAIFESINKVSHKESIDGVCIGLPGRIDKREKKILKVANVPYLEGLTFTEVVSGVSTNVIAENDASLAGLAEATMGAGVSSNVVVYITLSTGVGGVRIVNKKIDPYENHSEPGHMVIQAGGRGHDSTGILGSFEAYCSGTAFSKIYHCDPKDCDDQHIWNDYAKNLSIGLLNVIAMWAPDIIILGGSVSNKYEQYFKKPLHNYLSQQSFFEIPYIAKSSIGDDAGIYGGFAYLSE